MENNLSPLADRLRSGKLDLHDYLDELELIVSAFEPTIQALLPEPDRFGRLHRAADRLLATYPDVTARPPLFGVPVGVKDIFNADDFDTRAGSSLPPALFAGPEAASVTALKNAGALILGKMVTTEFAYFAPGVTRNPVNPAHTPGGSSSGSAAGVAAGFCPLALGSQTIGSVIRPAAFCGVVGFKPSFGRITTTGVVPVAPSLDQVGFFTTDSAGIGTPAAVLCRGWRSREEDIEPILGVPYGPYLARADVAAIAWFRNTCVRLADAGFEVQDVTVMSDFADIHDRHLTLMAAEVAHVHRDWYEAHAERYHERTSTLIQHGRRQAIADVAAAGEGRCELREILMALMRENSLAAWIAPSAPGPAPFSLAHTGDPVMNLPWTYAGLPAINVPCGRADNGLPLGLQIVGRYGRDEELVVLAERLEAALG